ncbi:hypothetical protein BDW22DRAFT_1329878 [Trametopsis cervina]|nr:hypothetical protein BDW22DRAFT_1329878 [Trametopsis cervina]
MATTARQPKPPRKGMGDPPARRPSAWTANRPSPTFSPGPQSARLPGGPQPNAPGGFPPLAQQNAAPRADRPVDRVLQQLSGLTRYEGVIGSTGGEGDSSGVTLKDVKEISNPGQPLKEQLFIAATNIDTWASGPADAKAPNGDSFKTDVDISQKIGGLRERPLQAWADDIPENTTASGRGGFSNSDDLTFGAGASTGNNQWDQFAANEKLFGVKAGFDEEAYTTKLDRNAPDYKEREKKAQAIANEIISGTTNNPHIAEERVMNLVGENGTTEEDKYGAVVRGANAYVPPGARKGGPILPVKPDVPSVQVNGPDGAVAVKDGQPPASPAPGGGAANTQSTADPLPAFRSFVTSERDRLMKKKQALMKNEMDKRMADLVKFSQTFKLNKPIPEDLVTILAKDEEKQKQIRDKSTKDAESAQARTISAQALTTAASPLNPTTGGRGGAPSAAKLPIAGSPQPGATGKPGALVKTSSSTSASKDKRISMVIQAIPPFKGKRNDTPPSGNGAAPAAAPAPAPIRTTSVTNQNGAGPNTPLSPGGNRLNVNASSFKPINKNSAQSNASVATNGSASTSTASPKPKPAESSPTPSGPPNPFFGTRTPKRGPPVHIKDDFNPFKYNKVAEASQVQANWPYNGKRYMQLFPSPPAQPQQHSPHLPPPGPPAPVPPQQYEENSEAAAQAAQAAARSYVYAYPPYGYPGQHMMPGMAPPGHMQPFMPHMHYPYMPPPNGQFSVLSMYPGSPMGQMPPPQYMPPPGAYPPPPNGAGPRPSMPPTPIPSHAHAYYHQSPQISHAVPYPMMMPPPGGPGAPPMQYDGSPAPPVPMQGGHP